MSKIDPHTFGDSQAQINLASIINELLESNSEDDLQIAKRATRMMAKYGKEIHAFKHIDSPGLRGWALTMFYREKYAKRIKEIKDAGYPLVASHMTNSMVTMRRNMVRSASPIETIKTYIQKNTKEEWVKKVNKIFDSELEFYNDSEYVEDDHVGRALNIIKDRINNEV